jgi:hypothetical protein
VPRPCSRLIYSVGKLPLALISSSERGCPFCLIPIPHSACNQPLVSEMGPLAAGGRRSCFLLFFSARVRRA